MPTYEYECSACSHAFEILQSIADPKLKKCPKCGKLKLDRLIGSGSGIIFKGSGFYETDYKKKTPPSSSPKADTSASPSAKPKKNDKPSTGCGPACGCGN